MCHVSSLSVLRIARRRWRSAGRLSLRLHAGGLPGVVFVTDPVRTDPEWSAIGSFPRGWAVIYRHFGSSCKHHTAMRIVAEARRRGVMVLIAADPELARRVGADGVHWPERMLRGRVERCRPHWIITASAHDARAVRRARDSRVDAVIVSPVMDTVCQGASGPLGLRRFGSVVSVAGVPCYGLGGISDTSSGRVAALARVAAVGDLVRAFGPVEQAVE